MTSGGEKSQVTTLSPKNQAELQTRPAFEIVSPKPADAQSGMKVRFAEAITDRIDRFPDLAAARFRQFPHIAPKRF